MRSVASRVAPDPARLAEFGEAFDKAENPVLILGSAIARGNGWDQAVTLAERLGVPVWAAPSSERPPFPEDHPLYMGGLPFATGPLSEKLQGHDLALVIGAPVFRYYPYVPGPYLPDGMTRLLHITDDPEEAGRAPVGDSLVADAVLAVEQLTEKIERQPRTQTAARKQDHGMAPHSADPDPSGDALTPRKVYKTVHDSMPEDTIVVEESPSSLADLHSVWPSVLPDTFYTAASGGLGFSLPASVGDLTP